MSKLLHQLIKQTYCSSPNSEALIFKNSTITYKFLWESVSKVANGLQCNGLKWQDRVAICLPSRIETVIACFAITKVAGIFVPINPALKPSQVGYILHNSGSSILFITNARFKLINSVVPLCPSLQTVIFVDSIPETSLTQYKLSHSKLTFIEWSTIEWSTLDVISGNSVQQKDTDTAAIFYTSGSSGKPKGVVLTHKNMVAGAKSVSSYLHNTDKDKILAILPLSFDYGFSQLSSAFYSKAWVVLTTYLFPSDVLKISAQHNITGIAAIPTLWNELSQLAWPESVTRTLRYITNSGAAMPTGTLQLLRQLLPSTQIYLMYGLTEAFRSTYLPPDELDNRPTSVGKAVPGAELMLVRSDGTACGPNEEGELVHTGILVAKGYWNNPEATAKRFKPSPLSSSASNNNELAVWSGDYFRMDADGYLYFIGRKDAMIKTSGYRISPDEIESVFYQSKRVNESIALGLSHPKLGQVIAVIASTLNDSPVDEETLLTICKQQLPSYMIPKKIVLLAKLPHNSNSKIDRAALLETYNDLFIGKSET